jgi:hypothetical protein
LGLFFDQKRNLTNTGHTHYNEEWLWWLSPSVCMRIPSSFARQRFSKHVRSATNTQNNGRIVGSFSYAVLVLSKESLWFFLCIPLQLAGNNSVKTFLRQRRIVCGAVLYAVRVVAKVSRRSVLPDILVILPFVNSFPKYVYWLLVHIRTSL